MKQNHMEYKPKKIDDKEAIKWIEYRMMEGRLNGSDKEPVIDEPYQAGMIAINAIYNKRRWISVTEKLPEVGQRVIATIESIDGNYVRETIYDKHGFLCGKCIAWMPLPESYKEIRNDD